MVVRRLRSITPAQVGIVVEAVAALRGAWWVERHDDCDGYLSLVVSLDGDDAPTFAITGEADRIDLSEVRNDALHAHGNFGTAHDAAGALLDLLKRGPS